MLIMMPFIGKIIFEHHNYIMKTWLCILIIISTISFASFGYTFLVFMIFMFYSFKNYFDFTVIYHLFRLHGVFLNSSRIKFNITFISAPDSDQGSLKLYALYRVPVFRNDEKVKLQNRYIYPTKIGQS